MEITRANVFKLLGLIDAKPSKDYGQNFLVDPIISKRITDLLETNTEDYTLEIGPGLGSLTHFLNMKSGELDCVDIDEKMVSILNTVYKNNLINIILNDARKVPLEKYTKIIGNLPYNITTELIAHVLLNAKECKQYVFMIQAEAINRFIDTTGKEYGPVSVLIHLLGTIKKEFIVKAGSFYPAPKCNSVVFQIKRTNNIPREVASEVYRLAKKLFLNRRKTLLNNMTNAFGKDKALAVLQELRLPDTVRPEEISPEMFLNIYNLVK